MDRNMPALDAARWGGPSGWRMIAASSFAGFPGVGIDRIDDNGKVRRHAVKATGTGADIAGAMLILKLWARK